MSLPTTAFTTDVSSATVVLDDLVDQADQLTTQIADLERRRDALWTTIELLQTSAGVVVDSAPPVVPVIPPGMPGLPPGPIRTIYDDALEANVASATVRHDSTPGTAELGISPPDFTGTYNLTDRLYRIYEAAEGEPLHVGLISRLLLQAGLTQASLAEVQRDVSACLSGHAKYFERVDNGVYRYRDREHSTNPPH